MGEITDLIFTIIGKLGRWFNVKGKKVCFVLWAICLVYWMARNWDMNLWVQTGGCVVSFCFHIYGYFNWKKEKIGENLMPTYEYKCPGCQKTESYIMKMMEDTPKLCLECFHSGKPYQMKRGPGGGTAIHFTGSGFYETDYKNKE